MANIKKSFNFRNGVQVDDDNLKVSTTGLVGIGTTVPTEALDVRGNLVVSGVSSATSAQAGVLTVTTLNPTEIIGAGVSIKSGIITASSGIVTFYGDGINLLNLPTSQWADTIIGAGVSSIYNTGGNVGIATTAALFTLQVGNDVNSGQKGVGISSFGDIKASGIATATGFVGALTGNVTGNLTGVAASTTQLETARTIGGVSFDGTSNIDLAGVNIAGNQNTSGTAANLSGTPNILINNLSVSGISTFSEDVITGVGATVGLGTHVYFGDNVKATFGSGNEVKMYHKPDTSDFRAEFADTNFVIMTRTLDVKNQAGNKATITAFEPGGISEVRLFNDGNEKLRTTGFGVTIFNQLDTTNIVASGVITATTELNSPLIGVGTDTPANEIQVRKSGNAEIQVTSDTGVAGLTVGRESGTGNTNNAEFRYGGGSGFTYSSAQSLDILNYGTGNFNYHISANDAGAVAGDFHWHKGNNNARLMTLTGIGGSLGIGNTQPTKALDVTGAGNFSGDLTVGNNLNVTGTVIGNIQGQLTGNVTGTLAGNSNATVGISTLNNLSVAGVATISVLRSTEVGIGTTVRENNALTINDGNNNRVYVNTTGEIGIKTSTTLSGVTINASQVNASIGAVAIGATVLKSSVDFADAGTVTTRFMLPPKITTAERGNLTGLVSGAMIYNTNLNKLQVYNGSAWETVTSS